MRIKICTALLVVAGTSPLVVAQAILEEVIVTAQKREQGLQDVPIAVQAFSTQRIDGLSADDIGDLAAFTPNVDIPRGSNQPTYRIRGIGTSDFGVGADPAVGVYMDGVYIGRSGGSKVAFNDIARIEILNGPQGTLFGRNAAAGAIQYISNKPNENEEGWVQATVGEYDRAQIEGIYNMPVTDKLYWRVGALYNQRDGFVDNTFTAEDHLYQKNWSLTSALRWQPSNKLDLIWRVDYDEIDQDSKAVTSAVFGAGQFSGGDFDETATNRRLTETRQLFGTSLHLSYELPGATFTSITSYREYETENPENQDGWNDPEFEFNDFNAEDNEQWSQEFRFSGDWGERVMWTVGGNYHEEVARQTSGISLNPIAVDRLVVEREVGIPYSLVDPGFGYEVAWAAAFPHLDRLFETGAQALMATDYSEYIDVEGDYTSWAIFTDFTVEITDSLSLTAGVRYTEDKKDFQRLVRVNDHGMHFAFTPTFIDASGNYDPSGSVVGAVKQDGKWDETTPRLVVDWAITDDVLLYASWAEGYKAGGFNSAGDRNDDPAFDPANVENLEFGIKSTWLDNTLRINAAYFDYTYENLQALQLIPAACLPESNFASHQFETSDVEGDGFELAINWAALEGLEFWGNLGTLDASYSDRTRRSSFRNAQAEDECRLLDESGQKFGSSAELSYALGATYTYPVTGGGEISGAVSWGWQEGATDRRSCSFIQDLGTGTSAYYELDTIIVEVDGQQTDQFVISKPSALGTLTEPPFDSCPDRDDREQLNLRLAWLSGSGSWEVAGWVTNATDWAPEADAGGNGPQLGSAFSDGAPSYDRREPPRMYGMELKYIF